ncbi:LysR family transcriptional regulator [Xylophilus sp. GOD-11R]|uniref:LysR family transcriptional regulator n=1 Tax=Xylophilus sp. GOD-11R TaxID=3089814 RepID=UPI00298C614A|nr:LysR family transcriptional regulator [Xylophilus sp. GOD-11R]WPB56367.1 LysR family transcriptional regulator [Xylophilus sp. GOD-11R]
MRHSIVPAVLRYIDQVARSGSIQQAARELHVAASAINRQLLQLEEALGVPLFDRLPRGMRLTPPGDAIVTLARRWREDERRMAGTIRQMQGVHQGQVRMMAMDSQTTSAIPRLVEALAVAHPRVSLSVEVGSTDEAVSALLAGHVEVASVFNLEPRRELVALWSAPLPLGCIVAPGHALAAGDSTSLQEVCSHPIVLQSKALLIRRYLESHYRWLFGEGPQRVETNSLQLLKQLVASGRYVALTSELDAAPELAAGTLRFLPLRDQGVDAQSVDVVIDARKPMSAVARIVARLLEQSLAACLAQARGQKV